jgi:hypothetical protein
MEQQKREPGRDPPSSLTAERLGETTPIIFVQLGSELPLTGVTKWLHDSDGIARPENCVTLSPCPEEYQ